MRCAFLSAAAARMEAAPTSAGPESVGRFRRANGKRQGQDGCGGLSR
jgi:hypothetical protein